MFGLEEIHAMNADVKDFHRVMKKLGVTNDRLDRASRSYDPARTKIPEHEKVDARPSAIHGRGVFAKDLIVTGEVAYCGRDAKGWTAAGLLGNHAENPNAVMRGNCVVASRDIPAGEEVTTSYEQVAEEVR